jgi:hypothetical protein
MFENPYVEVTDAQGQFVRSQGAILDSRGWTVDYRENLFAPLHSDSTSDFEESGELEGCGGGRIAAPHSSTASTVNVFDVWRGRDPGPIGAALQVDAQRIVGYEKPHGFGFRRAAQPDIEILGAAGTPTAIEVKLREPYGSVRNEFADRYFSAPGLWDGLPALHELAASIRDGDTSFTTLHAAQLVKHALGLRHSYGDSFVLGYLWHYVPSTTGDNHVRELNEFAAVAREDITFMSTTVAELLDRFDADRTDREWLDYMTSRYVTSTGQ